MRRFIALAASAAAVAGTFAVTAPANAADPKCGSEGDPALGIVPVDAGPAGRYYVDDRNFPTGNGLWLYKESTNNTTLQRKAGTGSSAPVVGKTLSDNGSTEICTDSTVSDTLYL